MTLHLHYILLIFAGLLGSLGIILAAISNCLRIGLRKATELIQPYERKKEGKDEIIFF
jgi:hypothetical protein